MSLHNLRDAGTLIPSWVSAGLLTAVFFALYLLAYMFYGVKPHSMVSAVTTASVLLSIVLAAIVVVREIVEAPAGEVAQAFNRGLVTGLNITWATSAIAFVAYITWTPGFNLIMANTTTAVIAVSACAVVFVGYSVAKPQLSKEQSADPVSSAYSQALALHPDFKATPSQRPVFQATIADLTRLLTHQAGRAIGYAGSNVLFDDTFSLELDVNARVGRVYSNTNIVNTEDFMYWRLHMLLMGPAAEKVLLGQASEASVDDFTSFDELAGRYLILRHDRSFNAAPINQQEAALKASRVSFLRKNVYDRCLATCHANKPVLLSLIKLMRTRSVLTYGDIRSHLERVNIPEGFPMASFDDGDLLQQALLQYHEHDEVTLEGQSSLVEAKEEATPEATATATATATAKPAATATAANEDLLTA